MLHFWSGVGAGVLGAVALIQVRRLGLRRRWASLL